MKSSITALAGDRSHGLVRTFDELRQTMEEAKDGVDSTLSKVLPVPHGPQHRVHEAMRYAVFAGGKRLRPFLVMACAELFGADRGGVLRVAAAIEALHTYSLVHDDLPCMDDDDLRRGRPTVHVAFDEATAVLAGDALLTIAFEILASAETHPSGEVRAQLVGKLAAAAGSNGMIGGQMIDIEAEGQLLDRPGIVQLQRLKTGALFEFCCESGAILAQAGADHQTRLKSFARDFGLAYQITDDLLDAVGDVQKTGKAVGKDVEQGKATLISVEGVDGARLEAEKLVGHAVAILEPYGQKATALRDLAFFLLERES